MNKNDQPEDKGGALIVGTAAAIIIACIVAVVIALAVAAIKWILHL